MSNFPDESVIEKINQIYDPAHQKSKEQKEIKEFEQKFQKENFTAQIILLLLVIILWKIPIFNPVKLLVVIFHELSHILIAVLTGGKVVGMTIDPGGAGVTLGIGGHELLIMLAGYTGSLLLGFLLYRITVLWEPVEVWAFLIILSFASMMLGWFNNATEVFGSGTIFLMFLGFFLSPEAKKLLLQVVAATCCMYPLIDIMWEVIQVKPSGYNLDGKIIASDVSQIAQMLDINKAFVGIFWVGSGLIMLIYLIFWSTNTETKREVAKSFFHKPFRKKKTFEYTKYDKKPDDDLVREYKIK